LPWATALSVSYIGIQSSGLPARANFNQLPVGQLTATRPFPVWASLSSVENLEFASYEGMRTELKRLLTSGVFLRASYVFSKNIGDAGAVGGRLLRFPLESNLGFTDRFNTRYDRGILGPSRRHRFLLTGLCPLPVGRGRALGSNWGGFRQSVFGGWDLSTVTMIESGPYQTPRVGVFFGPRPDRIGNGNLTHPTTDRYYDKSAFVPVPAGVDRLGNSGVGILEGPGTVAISAGLAKIFRMTEKLQLRLEGTFTNLPNHPNFAPPSTIVNNPLFGKLTAVQSGENAGNRTGQVGARLDF
jgi:hypothetical protein